MTGIIAGMDIAELSRLVENLIRFGTIHSVDHQAKRARVQSGQIITDWLRWIESRAGETTTWNPPTIGEQCVVLSPSGEIAQGMIIYGAPSDLIDTPSHDLAKHVIKFPDGAVFSYDHASSHLEISGMVTAAISASESIILNTPLTHCTGKLTADDLLTYGNGINGTGGANNNAIIGNFTHTGGSLSSNGIVLATHTHTGVYPGGGNTGGPT
jgi:phage baseplate assembly protein V